MDDKRNTSAYRNLKKGTLFILFLLISFCTLSQDSTSILGFWRGSYYPNGTAPKDGIMLYLDLSKLDEQTSKLTVYNQRYNTEEYAQKMASFDLLDKKRIKMNELVIAKQAKKGKTAWCRLQMELEYDPKTGYLQGTFSSKECKNYIGKVVLYRYHENFPQVSETKKELSETSLWWMRLHTELELGWNAPEIRQQERDNFIFEPIYFDFDKAEIKPDFFPFLDRLIKIVEMHSDLRVKVTGHTDWDGTDLYNDNLSKQRAQSIIDYFVHKGLKKERLEFDFKGEKEPIDTNQTPQGRQRNRRVDFQFI